MIQDSHQAPEQPPTETLENQEPPLAQHESLPTPEPIEPLFPSFAQWAVQLETEPDFKNRLTAILNYMQDALSSRQGPQFKEFWDAKQVLLELFKHDLDGTTRAALWAQYMQLSQQARHLKELVEEQSAFATEQLELAIQGLENEVAQLTAMLPITSLELKEIPACLKATQTFYETQQKELNFLNAYAVRVHALRKEVMKTDMRIRHKNKFFKKLSLLGDLIFPKRKELIRTLSQQFVEDVRGFVGTHFQEGRIVGTLFTIREDIKAFQGLAKMFTLNTQAFTQTRDQLSHCWDEIKLLEKERKKEKATQRVACKENFDKLAEELAACEQMAQTGTFSAKDLQHRTRQFVNQANELDLAWEDRKVLKERIHALRQVTDQHERILEQQQQEKEQEKERQKKSYYFSLKEEVDQVLATAHSMEVADLLSQRELLKEKILQAPCTKSERLALETLLHGLRDVIGRKKEQAFLSLPDDVRQSVVQLEEFLNERKQQRIEIKAQLEEYRKLQGSSSLDFEKAITYSELVEKERQALEKADAGILEIQTKLELCLNKE